MVDRACSLLSLRDSTRQLIWKSLIEDFTWEADGPLESRTWVIREGRQERTRWPALYVCREISEEFRSALFWHGQMAVRCSMPAIDGDRLTKVLGSVPSRLRYLELSVKVKPEVSSVLDIWTEVRTLGAVLERCGALRHVVISIRHEGSGGAWLSTLVSDLAKRVSGWEDRLATRAGDGETWAVAHWYRSRYRLWCHEEWTEATVSAFPIRCFRHRDARHVGVWRCA